MPSKQASMTPRERVLAAMRRDAVDYVPCCPKFNPLSPQQRVGKTWQFPWQSDETQMLQHCVEVLGVDMTVALPTGGWESSPEVTSSVHIEGDTLCKVYDTPAGQLSSTVRRDERWPHGDDITLFSDFNPAHATQYWIESEQDLECLRHIMRPVDRPETLEALREAHGRRCALAARWNLPTIAHIGMGLTGALQLFGPAELCIAAIEKPDLVHGYLQLEHEVNLRQIEIVCELGVDIVRRNGFYETADFYSPRMLEDLLFDRLQEEIRLAHEGGALTTYTVHTGVMPMLGYLRRLQFDCLMDIDISFRDTDLAAIRDSQEDSKSFWTGPSNTFHMWADDPSGVREAVRECFEVLDGRGLIITATPSAHSIMPWENTLAMIDEWRRLR